MTGSIIEIKAAIDEPLVFEITDLQSLDRCVRSRKHGEMSEGDLHNLYCELNGLASNYRMQDLIGNLAVTDATYQSIAKIERNAISILNELGLTSVSDPHEMPMRQLIYGSIFEQTSITSETHIRSIQTIVRCCREWRSAHPLKENISGNYDRRLYNDLGVIYLKYWQEGRLKAAANEERGGPAVRYFQFTLQRIRKRSTSAAAVKQMIAEMRKEHASSGNYPVFDCL